MRLSPLFPPAHHTFTHEKRVHIRPSLRIGQRTPASKTQKTVRRPAHAQHAQVSKHRTRASRARAHAHTYRPPPRLPPSAPLAPPLSQTAHTSPPPLAVLRRRDDPCAQSTDIHHPPSATALPPQHHTPPLTSITQPHSLCYYASLPHHRCFPPSSRETPHAHTPRTHTLPLPLTFTYTGTYVLRTGNTRACPPRHTHIHTREHTDRRGLPLLQPHARAPRPHTHTLTLISSLPLSCSSPQHCRCHCRRRHHLRTFCTAIATAALHRTLHRSTRHCAICSTHQRR